MEPLRRVSVFLPAFNEVKNLEGAVQDIVWAADGVLAEYEILVVNDGSTDGTRELADRLAHENPRARQPHRRFLTWASTTLVNVLFGLKMHYYQGPCIYPVALARALPKTEGGFYFLTQMLIHALHAGYSCVEVGLTHVERTSGRSKAVSFTNILKALRAIARVWWAIYVKHDTVARRA